MKIESAFLIVSLFVSTLGCTRTVTRFLADKDNPAPTVAGQAKTSLTVKDVMQPILLKGECSFKTRWLSAQFSNIQVPINLERFALKLTLNCMLDGTFEAEMGSLHDHVPKTLPGTAYQFLVFGNSSAGQSAPLVVEIVYAGP